MVAGDNQVLLKYLQKLGMGNEELERFDLEGAGTGTAWGAGELDAAPTIALATSSCFTALAVPNLT